MRLAIIALSARIYTQLASLAGHTVLAIDAYGDHDTLQAAHAYAGLPTLDHLDEASFAALMAQLEQFQPEAVLVGAWFEHQIGYYEALVRQFNVLGVPPLQVAMMKSPEALAQYCQQQAIAMPPTRRHPPAASDVSLWLCKQVGGSGGHHVQRHLTQSLAGQSHHYWQQWQPGQVIGALVLVSHEDILVIGVHLLHQSENGFQYAGASTWAQTSQKQAMQSLCHALLPNMGGLGLMSVDAIDDGQALHLIDVNPRLSASMRLYRDWPLIDMHISVCMGQSRASDWSDQPRLQTHPYQTHRICYAKSRINLCEMGYPAWIEDQPAHAHIDAGQPFFSLTATGNSQAAVMQTLVEKHTQLIQQWGTYVCNNIEFNCHERSSSQCALAGTFDCAS